MKSTFKLYVNNFNDLTNFILLGNKTKDKWESFWVVSELYLYENGALDIMNVYIKGKVRLPLPRTSPTAFGIRQVILVKYRYSKGDWANQNGISLYILGLFCWFLFWFQLLIRFYCYDSALQDRSDRKSFALKSRLMVKFTSMKISIKYSNLRITFCNVENNG